MLYIERREKILEMLRKSGNVKVSDLVDIFHVDATTIRRDLKALADNEKVKMVYGGAYYINEMSQWPIEDNPDNCKNEDAYSFSKQILPFNDNEVPQSNYSK